MWNINTIEYYSATSKDEILSGGFNAALLSATDEEKDYQDMICLGRKGGRFSQGEKGLEPFSPGAFIRFIRIGIQIKPINHCQPVRVKQYKIYRELWRAYSELQPIS